MDFIQDHGADGAKHLSPAGAREEQVERLGRRDQNMRRPLEHGRAIARAGVARSHEDAKRGEIRIQLRELGERPLEVLLNVVPERLERRYVEDERLVAERLALPEEGIDRPEKCGERLSCA